jgi:glutamate transport system permease protein
MIEVLTGFGSDLLRATGVTVGLTALSFALAMVIGTAVAIMRISPIAPLRFCARLYVEVFVNIPLVALLVVVTFGLPDIGLTFSLFWCAVLSMALIGAAFASEAVRSGVNAVGVGQIEAARAIGLPFRGVLAEVVLPQAFRSSIPPLVNVFIAVLLSSSLAGIIGVGDLTLTASEINNKLALGLTTFLMVSVFYLVVSLASGAVGAWVEKKVAVLR